MTPPRFRWLDECWSFGTRLAVVVAIGGAIGWLRDLAVRGEAQARALAELDAARARSEQRLRAILGVSRRLAAEPTGDRMLGVVLDEAARLLGADAAAVFRWDEATQQLVRVRNTLPGGHALPPAVPGEGVLGRAVAERRSVTTEDYQTEPGGVVALKEIGVRAAAAAPLLEKGQLLGALWVGALTPERRFGEDDVATLELLAASAAAVLRGLERARLEGVVLTARTAQHEVNNALTISLGYSELLARHPALPEELRSLAEHAFGGAMEAADRLQRLQEITEIVEMPWGEAGPTIDLGPRETS